MAVEDAWVTVKKSQFDCLRQHCEHCPDFREQLQDLSDERAVVIPLQSPSGEPSKKRKTLHESGSQEASQPSHPPQQPEPQWPSQPSQEPGLQLSSRSSNISQCEKPARPRAKAPRKTPQQKPRKIEAVDWFLRNVPKATEWRKRQTELELNTVEQYEQTIRAFTDRTNIIVKREPFQREEHSKHELVDLAERFALLTKASLTNAKRQRSFATFQALILLSYCEVLRKRDFSYETVDRIIEHIAGERDRRRLLSGARWINGVIVDLVSHGWTIYRAIELFFIDALSLTNLTHIHNNENLQSILKHLKTDEFMKHDYGDCLRPEFTIPGLIASLLDACNIAAIKISIDEICATLGYNSDHVPKSVESIYKVQAAYKSTPVCPVNPSFEVYVPNCFRSNDGLASASSPDSTIRAADPPFLNTQESRDRYMSPAMGLQMLSGNDVVETFLAPSKFGALTKRQHFLSMAAKSPRNPGNIHLQADIVHRESVLLRLKGNICDSKRRIREFFHRSNPGPDLRSHFVFGLLHLSQATNYAYNFDFCQAHEEAQKWKPLGFAQGHMDVVWDQVYFAGRVFRGQGSFNEAKQCFERCLAADRLCESKRILIKSNLADLYSELDYSLRKRSNPNGSEECVTPEITFLDYAEEMVKPELEPLKARGRRSKGYRRLLLSLIEVEIRRDQFKNAEILISELLGIYSRLTEPDIIDRLGHVRALIAWARISPVSEAEGRWCDAVRWNRKYNPLEEEVFTCGLVYLFICSIRFQLGNLDGSRAVFDRAMEVISRKKPQFLIPGVGTYLFDSVRLQIKRTAGWMLPGII